MKAMRVGTAARIACFYGTASELSQTMKCRQSSMIFYLGGGSEKRMYH